jgi:hypothetical protein
MSQMKHCHGAPANVQADCGAAGPHGEHDYDAGETQCPGMQAGFEGGCGHPGPHGQHDANSRPTN